MDGVSTLAVRVCCSALGIRRAVTDAVVVALRLLLGHAMQVRLLR
jgi:hypothetical protein